MGRGKRDSRGYTPMEQYRRRVGRHDTLKCKELSRRMKLIDEYRAELDPNAFKDLFILSSSFIIAASIVVYFIYYCLYKYSKEFFPEE
ncbi:hypothetical protein C0J52_09630 [Blattella germanica]|nr:hypothetical protein C0J52_09630 [Blattella germanica]